MFRRIIGLPIRLFYKLFVNWLLGIDISDTTQIGKNLIVWHGIGLIVHPKTIIGDNVVLRHNTTIGSSKHNGGAPILCNGCDIGSNSVILGEIIVGENSKIGAGSVVTKSVPPYSVVVGNPGKVIKYLRND
jgi:serine acetyltransferase